VCLCVLALAQMSADLVVQLSVLVLFVTFCCLPGGNAYSGIDVRAHIHSHPETDTARQ
jgi:hypothetical protein